MRRVTIPLIAVVAVGLVSRPAALQEITNQGAVGSYELVDNWPKLAHPYPRQGYVLGSQGGIFAESPNRIFLANRGELKLPAQLPARFNGFWESLDYPAQANANGQQPEIRNSIIIVDAEGSLVESWTQWDHLFDEGRGPHIIRINPHDPERHVWVVDDYHHQIFKFTNDGRSLVQTIGTRDLAGSDGTHFRRPTDLDWLPDGTFFVSDGYGNTRVAKFDRNGNFLMDWGTRGSGAGQFNSPHGIAVGLDRRVYVSDRGNKRIQVFDENGRFVAEWPKIMAQTLMMSGNGHLWLYDSDQTKYVAYDLTGQPVSWFSIPGSFAHQISAGENGVVYAAGSRHGRPLKYGPKPGADPDTLMRPIPLKGAGLSGTPANVNYSGAWKLETNSAPSRAGRGTGNDFGFESAAPTLIIAQTPSELTLTNGPIQLNFKMDGNGSVNTEYANRSSGSPTRTWIRWRDGKLMLFTKQGLNLGHDTLTLSGNTLTIVRDINTAGSSFVATLVYSKIP